MILVAAIAASLAVGLARGGRLGNLAQLRVRFLWLPLFLFAAQTAAVIFPLRDGEELWRLGPLVVVGTYAALIAFVLLNRHLPGARLLLLGAALNLAVITANSGYMPVSRESLERAGHEGLIVARGDALYVQGSKDIVLDRSETHLWPLSDVFVIPQGVPLAGSFSLGDVVIALGGFLLINQALMGIGPSATNPRSLPPKWTRTPAPIGREKGDV